MAPSQRFCADVSTVNSTTLQINMCLAKSVNNCTWQNNNDRDDGMPTVWGSAVKSQARTHTRSSHSSHGENGNNVSRADMTKMNLIISIMMIRSFITSDPFIIICRESFQILTKQIWIALFAINKHSNTHGWRRARACVSHAVYYTWCIKFYVNCVTSYTQTQNGLFLLDVPHLTRSTSIWRRDRPLICHENLDW